MKNYNPTAIEGKASDTLQALRAMFDEMIEVGRMRSDFALKHFVVGQHDTPGRQRAQALAELQAMYFSLADVYDEIELAEVEREELEASIKDKEPTARQQIERRRIERKFLSQTIHLHQRMQEVDCLLNILKGIKKYTAEELEAEEPVYWSARLARQAFMAHRDPGGNVDAILQMITAPGLPKPLLPVSPADFLLGTGMDVKQIASGLVNAKLLTIEQADEFVSKYNSPKQINPPPRPPARKRRK